MSAQDGNAARVAARLRESIVAERKRLERRPVPTDPWVMPAGLDDLSALLDVIERLHEAVQLIAVLGMPSIPIEEPNAANLLIAIAEAKAALADTGLDGYPSGTLAAEAKS